MSERARASGPRTVQLLMSLALLGEVEDEWRRLAERAGAPFLTPEWHRAWLAHHPRARPLVGVVRDGDGGVLGVLPLVSTRHGVLRVLHFAGDDLGDAFGPLCAEGESRREIARLIAQAIAAGPAGWDLIVLGFIDLEAAWHPAFADALGGRISAIERRRAQCPVIDVAGANWTDYLAGRSRGFRKETRRRRRRVDEDESSRFIGPGDDDAEASTQTLFRLHDMRWNGRGGSDIDARSRLGLADFNAAAAVRGWLQLWQLELDGRPVASELAWRVGGRQTHFQGGFDPDYAPRGVGLVLFAHVVEDGFGNGADSLDLGRGISAYKMQFATGMREATTLILVRSGHPLRPLIGLAMIALRLMKSLPRERVAGLRSRLGRLRRRPR